MAYEFRGVFAGWGYAGSSRRRLGLLFFEFLFELGKLRFYDLGE